MSLVSFIPPEKIKNVFRGFRKRPVAWNELNRIGIGPVLNEHNLILDFYFPKHFKPQPRKMIKHTKKHLSVFDYFVGLARKGLMENVWKINYIKEISIKKCRKGKKLSKNNIRQQLKIII